MFAQSVSWQLVSRCIRRQLYPVYQWVRLVFIDHSPSLIWAPARRFLGPDTSQETQQPASHLLFLQVLPRLRLFRLPRFLFLLFFFALLFIHAPARLVLHCLFFFSLLYSSSCCSFLLLSVFAFCTASSLPSSCSCQSCSSMSLFFVFCTLRLASRFFFSPSSSPSAPPLLRLLPDTAGLVPPSFCLCLL